ncbi:Hypothetical predicted protein [Podarcis lilfordi]|uniref:Serine palmitoyltransferase small subunit B n=1 Tax=Podarcis lilfordi TaxID=74358 RepID=A0AA35KFC0_9SAUR|nr:Hypothetical predicted protein [Podarcis lilfordi]
MWQQILRKEQVWHRSAVKTAMAIKRKFSTLSWYYWQYQLITMAYLMDPFEWWIFHSLLLACIMGSAYVFYVVVPPQICLVLKLVYHVFGLQPESTIPAMM